MNDYAQYRKITDEISRLSKRCGGDFEQLSKSDFARMRELTDEAAAIEARNGGHSPHPGFPVQPGDRSGATPPQSKGWRAGHWSQPFLKGVGHKDLTPSGAVTVPSLSGGIVPIADRPMRLLDVIPSEAITGTDSYAYLREDERDHAAAETAAGTAKPVSTYEVSKVEDTVRVIAHVTAPVNRFDLEDAALLGQYVDGSLRQGVMLRLDSQVLAGDGVPPNLLGLADTVGIQTQVFDTDVLTTARKSLSMLQAIEIPNGVYVLSPAMWEGLELTTVGADEHYALGAGLPVDRARQRLWGQPVVVTSALAGDNAYLVDFAGSTRLYEREGVRVDWSEAPEGSVTGEAAFTSNELIFRGEGRFGFAVLRPSGVVQFETTAA